MCCVGSWAELGKKKKKKMKFGVRNIWWNEK